jgi:hypothetical protein
MASHPYRGPGGNAGGASGTVGGGATSFADFRAGAASTFPLVSVSGTIP